MKKIVSFPLLLAAALRPTSLPLTAATPRWTGCTSTARRPFWWTPPTARFSTSRTPMRRCARQHHQGDDRPAHHWRLSTRGRFTLEQEITASSTVNDRMISGASTQNIKAGEIMPLKDVLACALIPSANRACNILAETIGGGIGASWR